MSDKTEEATPRRLRKARDEGDVAVSGALVQAVALLAALAVLPSATRALTARAGATLRAVLADPTLVLGPEALATEVLALVVPLLLVAALAAAAAALTQSGGVIAVGRITPNFGRLDPVAGLLGLFSWQRIASLARALVAAALVAWLAVRLLVDHAAELAFSAGNAGAAAGVAAELSLRVIRIAALVGLALGAVDLLLTRRAWLARLRMSKDEVRREYRESEGDPEIKAARRRAHEEMLRGATLAAVRQATVVIVNPEHLATALSWHEEEDQAAPRVVAQGQGELAKQIIEAARAYGVPVLRDVPVAQALKDLEIGDEIPEALYEAVAEILREVWESDPERAEGR